MIGRGDGCVDTAEDRLEGFAGVVSIVGGGGLELVDLLSERESRVQECLRRRESAGRVAAPNLCVDQRG